MKTAHHCQIINGDSLAPVKDYFLLKNIKHLKHLKTLIKEGFITVTRREVNKEVNNIEKHPRVRMDLQNEVRLISHFCFLNCFLIFQQ